MLQPQEMAKTPHGPVASDEPIPNHSTGSNQTSQASLELAMQADKLLGQLDPMLRAWLFSRHEVAPLSGISSVIRKADGSVRKRVISPQGIRNLQRAAARARAIRMEKIRLRRAAEREAKEKARAKREAKKRRG